jgi:peptidoglycan/xylan/chitin deacetylase (PgdA/CDA1 family)
MAEGRNVLRSHTHTHELLARQSESKQRDEFTRSREMIRMNLGINCDALAYPVGSPPSLSEVTLQALEDVGYRTAFSYYGGISMFQRIERFNVL